MQDLYELKDEYKTLEATLNEMFECGEIDGDCVNNTLAAITGSLEDKCFDLARSLKNKEAYIAGLEHRASEIEDRLKQLKLKIKRNQGVADYYASLISSTMKTLKKDKIENVDFIIKEVGKKASVIITDESLIPDKYIYEQSVKKISKQDAYKDLSDGHAIPGMKLGENKKIVIR